MILGYARVSTPEQAMPGTTSLDEQQRRTRAIALLRSPNEFDYSPYVDVGVSGSTPLFHRPAGKRMLDDAQPGDVIVATKLDRMFRSARDALITVEQLHERKVDIILMDISMEPIAEGNAIAHLFFTIMSAVAEFERRQIATRMEDGRRGKRAKFDASGHTGGVAPYGWRIEGAGREARLIEVPEEQKVVARVLSLFADTRVTEDGRRVRTHTMTSIVRRLTQEGFASRSGKPFVEVQIARIVEKQQKIAGTFDATRPLMEVA